MRKIVERTLERSFDQLKDTVLAIDVFGREPDFNPKADPIVRIEAGKIRKKLERYYTESRSRPVRITLPVGSYVAEFVFDEIAAPLAPTIAVGIFRNAIGDSAY